MPAPFESLVSGPGRYLRPTSVIGRDVAGQNVAIQIIGLRDCERIPFQLREAYEAMLRRLTTQVQHACRAVVPGGPDGKLGRQVHARIVHGGGVSNRIVVGTIGSQFARALDRGFTAPSSRFNDGKPTGKSLRGFEHGGKLVYTRRVRVAGRHFYPKWLALTPPIVEAVYDQSFYNIKDFA
jgi:hypothetical protein